MKAHTALLALILFPLALQAQSRDVEELLKLSQLYHERWLAGRGASYQHYLKTQAVHHERLTWDGRLQLVGVSPEGRPVYVMQENANAAATVSTDLVWPGETAGFELNGSGCDFLALWDIGGVQTTHPEFGGRVTQMDDASEADVHATHVAGTMIAAGTHPAARGMAWQANLSAWDPAVDVAEDYQFGFYDQRAHDFDTIACNAPGYLLVSSAGNDRDDRGPGAGAAHYVWIDGAWELSTDPRNDDGAPDGYDSMGPEKCSKNILTIGAIDDLPHGYQGPENVVMADFSNWGPTDDGRIKPDLVANGIAVFSPAPVGEVEYVAMTGTSSASPSVCGSLVLVRSYFEEELGYLPAAATLKALVLHTAHEAGIADGPDYQHGWGVLNTLGAVQIIQSHSEEERRIVENVLANQQQHSYQLQIAEGASVCATMVWTDPPGPVLPAQLDPTEPMLVHDLDLRITSPEAEVFLPWILDPVQPSQAATRGDNLRDNVEKIQFVAPASGIYSLAVSHKGSILEQAYSLTLTGAYLEACTERVPSTPTVCIHKRLQYIELQWQAITETVGGCPIGETVYYDLYRSVSSEDEAVLIATTTDTSFRDLGSLTDPQCLYHLKARLAD